MSPHENFKKQLAANVGRNVDVEPWRAHCSVQRDALVQKTKLHNGNEEYKFHYAPQRLFKACTYYCEVNPKKRIVVAVRIDEVESDCQIPPV
jgi:hypothetical protein